jgi:hypothetical protein
LDARAALSRARLTIIREVDQKLRMAQGERGARRLVDDREEEVGAKHVRRRRL